MGGVARGQGQNVQYKTAFVLTHKLREAMAAEIRQNEVGGENRVVEIDGGYFGGHIRQENEKADRKDRRLSENQTGKKQCVVIVRERRGKSTVKAFSAEDQSLDFIKSRVARGTALHADESPAWNPLHGRYRVHRINHSEAYSRDGACTNQAESYFSRLRRAELGQHHHIAGPYLDRYAREMAFREDHRRDPNGDQFDRVIRLVAANSPSIDFCGYWQRNKAA